MIATRLPAVVLLLLLAACEKSQPTGTWIEFTDDAVGPDRAEFFDDNTCYMDLHARTPCAWQLLDDGRVHVEVTIRDTPMVLMGRVKQDTLALEGAMTRDRWVRVGTPGEERVRAAIGAREDIKPGLEAYYNNDLERATQLLAKPAELGHPKALMTLAWLYATAADPAFQDGPKARRLAERALEWDDSIPTYWNTLAAAYAREGDFEHAIEAGNRAVEQAKFLGQDAAIPSFTELLGYYQNKKTFVIDQGQLVVQQ